VTLASSSRWLAASRSGPGGAHEAQGCGRLGALSQTFRAQWLLGLCHYFRAELQPARQIAEQLVERAHTLEDALFRVEAEGGSGRDPEWWPSVFARERSGCWVIPIKP
jgi:hypothetical protein